ncbi:MAG: monofunctional biosynthetic peptidoglycan transglycosylase [Paracoccaceae bacterium]
MAKQPARPRRKSTPKPVVAPLPLHHRIRAAVWVWGRRAALGLVLGLLLLIVAYRFVNPPLTHTMWAEARILGAIEHRWVPIEQIAPVALRSIVAAEDANFCLHWGFDMSAIRLALDEGRGRGASTLSQQTVKNVFLWQGRTWVRKALEALITPVAEAVWSKRRLLEIYVNVAEFDEGVFGIHAASARYFGKDPIDLNAREAARLAVVLPNPKVRSAAEPTAAIRARAALVRDGAATIALDGRAACFED